MLTENGDEKSHTMVPRNLAPSIEVIKFPLRSTDLKREAEYVAGYLNGTNESKTRR
jgi:hypothetical protein